MYQNYRTAGIYTVCNGECKVQVILQRFYPTGSLVKKNFKLLRHNVNVAQLNKSLVDQRVPHLKPCSGVRCLSGNQFTPAAGPRNSPPCYLRHTSLKMLHD